jgi:hypothetical protein
MTSHSELKSFKSIELTTPNNMEALDKQLKTYSDNILILIKSDNCHYTRKFLPTWNKFLKNEKNRYISKTIMKTEPFKVYELEKSYLNLVEYSNTMSKIMESFGGFPTIILQTRDGRNVQLIGSQTLTSLTQLIKYSFVE